MGESQTDALRTALQSRSKAEVIIETAILVIITTAALLGNLMVCWAVFRNKRLRTIPNLYIVTLAISDVLMATICMPLSVEVLVTSKWTKSFIVCQLQGFIGIFLALTSLQIMTAMAINRYYCVVKPAKYLKYFTGRRAIGSIVIAMALASVGAGLHLVCNWAIYTLHYGKVLCFPAFKTPEHEKGYIAFLDACYITSPILVISVCYWKIFRAVKRHKKSLFNRKTADTEKDGAKNTNKTQENAKEKGPRPQINVEEVKITKTLFVTVLGFIVCWSPIAIIDMIDSYSSHTIPIPRQVFLLWVYLGYGSSSINPFIYGILNRSFRKEFVRIFRSVRCRTQIQPQTTSHGHTISAVMSVQNRKGQGAHLQVDNCGTNTVETITN